MKRFATCKAKVGSSFLSRRLRAPGSTSRARQTCATSCCRPGALCNLQSESRVLFSIKAFKGPGEYITRATDLRDQLLSAGYEVREVEVVLSVRNGLPENYAMIRTVLEQAQILLLLEHRRKSCFCSSTVLIKA